MKRLADEIVHFFQNQGYVIVSTVDETGFVHNSCKGIVEIDRSGRVYLLDLYMAATYRNLQHDPHISITAVEEHKFHGYCLKGKAVMLTKKNLEPRIIKAWEDKITSRITRRVIRNIREEKGHPRHPEALLPAPTYLIAIDVEEIVDLTPHHLKEHT